LKKSLLLKETMIARSASSDTMSNRKTRGPLMGVARSLSDISGKMPFRMN
jgi:hypothetical protein